MVTYFTDAALLDSFVIFLSLDRGILRMHESFLIIRFHILLLNCFIGLLTLRCSESCTFLTHVEAPLVDFSMANAKAPRQASDVIRIPSLIELELVL